MIRARIKKAVYVNRALQKDKWYEVVGLGGEAHLDNVGLTAFYIKVPSQSDMLCRTNGCAHLGGGTWELEKVDPLYEDLLKVKEITSNERKKE